MQSSGWRKNGQEQLVWEMILRLAQGMKAEVIAAWAAEGRAHLHAPCWWRKHWLTPLDSTRVYIDQAPGQSKAEGLGQIIGHASG